MREAGPDRQPEEFGGREHAAIVRSARLALEAVQRAYPHHLVHLMRNASDLGAPDELYPTFSGAFDWHSAVHGHWTLIRALRLHPGALPQGVREHLESNLTPERIARDTRYFEAPGREGFERPYGLAWLLQLAAELREWGSEDARRWHAAIEPLERLAAERLVRWLPRLPYPIRSGEHPQTAFAMGVAFDWACVARHDALARSIVESAERFFARDREAPIGFEPSAHDFLSPVLAEADLMRRLLPPMSFPDWLRAFLPKLDSEAAQRWLEPVEPVSRSDGKLAHFDGLNLSRAWMLEGIAGSLDASAPVAAILARAAARHREAGLSSIELDDYAGTHWLGSFAVYLVTRRGLPSGTGARA